MNIDSFAQRNIYDDTGQKSMNIGCLTKRDGIKSIDAVSEHKGSTRAFSTRRARCP